MNLKGKDENTIQLLILARKKLRKLINEGEIGPNKSEPEANLTQLNANSKLLESTKIRNNRNTEEYVDENKDIRTIIKERFQMDPNKKPKNAAGKGDASAVAYLKKLHGMKHDSTNTKLGNSSNLGKTSEELRKVENDATKARINLEHKRKLQSAKYLSNFQAIRSRELKTINHLQKYTKFNAQKQTATKSLKFPISHNTNKYLHTSDNTKNTINVNKYVELGNAKESYKSNNYLRLDRPRDIYNVNKYIRLNSVKEGIKPKLAPKIELSVKSGNSVNSSHFANDESNKSSKKHKHRNIYEEVKTPPRPLSRNQTMIGPDGIRNMWRKDSNTISQHHMTNVKVLKYGPRYLLRKPKSISKRHVTLDAVPELNEFFDMSLSYRKMKPSK